MPEAARPRPGPGAGETAAPTLAAPRRRYHGGPVGQPVTFLRTASPRPGIVRFELNRSLTGMGHERYRAGEEITGTRTVDELARRLIDTGKVKAVHVYASMVTAELDSSDGSDLGEVIAGLHTYYGPGVEIPSDEELTAMAGPG